jgi:hypothetical protein
MRPYLVKRQQCDEGNKRHAHDYTSRRMHGPNAEGLFSNAKSGFHVTMIEMRIFRLN